MRLDSCHESGLMKSNFHKKTLHKTFHKDFMNLRFMILQHENCRKLPTCLHKLVFYTFMLYESRLIQCTYTIYIIGLHESRVKTRVRNL